MILSSAQFHCGSKRLELVAEISELGPGFRFEQIYPDSCDLGFTMVSARTGDMVDFVQVGTDKSGEDIAGWWFEPKPEHVKKNPKVAGMRVLIIND